MNLELGKFIRKLTDKLVPTSSPEFDLYMEDVFAGKNSDISKHGIDVTKGTWYLLGRKTARFCVPLKSGEFERSYFIEMTKDGVKIIFEGDYPLF